MTVAMKITIFLNVPHGAVDKHRYFRANCHLHYHRKLITFGLSNYTNDGHSSFFWNIHTCLSDHIPSHPRRR